MYPVNLGVDNVQLLHSQHPRHCLGLDSPQVRVVYCQLPAVEQSPEGVGDHVEQIEEVKLEMLDSLEAVKSVLTNDGGRLDLCCEITLPAPAVSSQSPPRPEKF